MFNAAPHRGSLRLSFAVVAIFAACGWSPTLADEEAASTPAVMTAPEDRKYFDEDAFYQSQYKREVTYLVARITRHIISMGEYAGAGKFTDPKTFEIIVKEWNVPGKTTALSEGRVRGGLITETLQFDLDWAESFMWEGSAYLPVATAALGPQKDEKNSSPVTAPDPAFVMSLTDISPESLEAADSRVSAALQENFRDPVWHVRAALLLGTFSMRERAGRFQDLTEPLCQMCAHLAIAEALNGKPLEGVEAELASALMDTLCGREVTSLPTIEKLRAYGGGYGHWANALRMRLTHDYRDFEAAEWTTSLEGYVAVRAAAESVSDEFAFEWFTGNLPTVMVLGAALPVSGLSVGAGNTLLRENYLGLEIEDARRVYALTHGKPAAENAPLSSLLNRFPNGSLERVDEDVRVNVLNKGLWAMAAQRSILLAAVNMHEALWCNLSLGEDAAELSEMIALQTQGLVFDPFIRLFTFSNQASYEKAVDDCFVYLQKTPELVSPSLAAALSFGPDKRIKKPYIPKPHEDGHSLDWRPLLPTFGTVENSFANSKLGAWFASPGPDNLYPQIHARAPHNAQGIIYYFRYLLRRGEMTPEKFDTMLGDLAHYDSALLKVLEGVASKAPEMRAHILSKRAMIDVDAIKEVLDTNWDEISDEKFDFLAQLLLAKNRNAVQTSHLSPQIVDRYLKMGNREQAKAWAEFGAGVYSGSGLWAMSNYLEGTGDLKGAAEYHRKNTQRYRQPEVEVAFITRMHTAGTTEHLLRGSDELLKMVFPNGIVRTPLADRKAPPTAGLVFEQITKKALDAGLLTTDVIVAVNGIDISNKAQYIPCRDSNNKPELLLAIYRNGRYFEHTVLLPRKLFGGNLITWKPE